MTVRLTTDPKNRIQSEERKRYCGKILSVLAPPKAEEQTVIGMAEGAADKFNQAEAAIRDAPLISDLKLYEQVVAAASQKLIGLIRKRIPNILLQGSATHYREGKPREEVVKRETARRNLERRWKAVVDELESLISATEERTMQWRPMGGAGNAYTFAHGNREEQLATTCGEMWQRWRTDLPSTTPEGHFGTLVHATHALSGQVPDLNRLEGATKRVAIAIQKKLRGNR